MAAMRSTQTSVGSKAWIRDENAQIGQFCAQETEDFTFSARNEVEWLNEHMADIFSKSQLNVTEIFKTPGKLRGKTPRTAKKRDPLETREPLTDIFSATARPNNTPREKTAPVKPSPIKTAVPFKVAEDPIGANEAKKATKANTDSGYHGLPEDDLDTNELSNAPQSSSETCTTVGIFPASPLRGRIAATRASEERKPTERCLHFERDEPDEDAAYESERNEAPAAASNDMEGEPAGETSLERATPTVTDLHEKESPEEAIESGVVDKELEDDLMVDESHSPSQGSSPVRPLVRKSSLTFAALPAREPLTTKKSIGSRVSRTSHLEQSKTTLSRGSFLGRFTGGKSLGSLKQPESTHIKESNNHMDIDMDVEMEVPGLMREDSDADSKMTRLHNKSSTQRLHDRINLLGKSQPTRPTKSIPAMVIAAIPSYPELPSLDPQQQQPHHEAASEAMDFYTNEQDDDDWIQPPQPQLNTSRPQLSKSLSVDVMPDVRGKQTIDGNDFDRFRTNEHIENVASQSHQINAHGVPIGETEPARAASASPSNSPVRDSTPVAAVSAAKPFISTTPTDSPSSKRYVDGPLSASKSKLQSIMKTARGLFSSSAGVSAQAKMETLSPPSIGGQAIVQGASIDETLESRASRKARNPNSPVENPVGRKTRSSTEKEEKRKESEAKERERAEADSIRTLEQERRRPAMPEQGHHKEPIAEVIQHPSKPTRQSPRQPQNQDAPKAHAEPIEDDQPGLSMGPPVTRNQPQQPQSQKPKEVRRPTKPAREAASKPKPQPVAIRVGTLSQGIRMNNATLSTSLQESLPPPQPKLTAVAKKTNNPTLHTTVSSSNLKNPTASATTTKPKALIAAERKKEQDEKEAQRKLEQKREIERKRAVQQEEARKQEQLQRQEAERQRERERAVNVEDPKILAKKQAIEKRRMEMKKDQQRMPQRPTVDAVPAAPQAQISSTSRQELGGPRPPSRLQNVPDNNRLTNNHPAHNPVKPPNKRVFDPDADEEPSRPNRMPGIPAYQPNDSKRRRTDDEEAQEVRIRPTMAPPIRQSGIRPGGLKPSIFSGNYSTAPPPASQHHNGPSLLKSTTANQAYQHHAHQNQPSRPGHHPDIAKYQSGKIPFADNPNPPHPSQPHKTPQPRFAPAVAKSSPQYVNGENIHLDDIPTESEDESDSDSGSKPKPANLPDWAQSPNLRELLMTQDENMDADAVFGPVQSPHMEEMFRERHHRFRSRTSSANWAGADRLTDEEIRRDVEARQRLRREGGWTFGL